SKETTTFRNNPDETALHMGQFGPFLIGDGVGGAGTHWNGETCFFSLYDFEIKKKMKEMYGKNKLQEEYTIKNWRITYDELEPYYEKFEKMAGTSGEPNPLRPERTRDYPTPPMKSTPMLDKFVKAANNLDLHPFRLPSANLSENYTNPDGQTLSQCQYCG